MRRNWNDYARYYGLHLDGSDCDGISLQPEFTEEDCKTQSTGNADSHAYIFDTVIHIFFVQINYLNISCFKN